MRPTAADWALAMPTTLPFSRAKKLQPGERLIDLPRRGEGVDRHVRLGERHALGPCDLAGGAAR
jgi:hypothetical protein